MKGKRYIILMSLVAFGLLVVVYAMVLRPRQEAEARRLEKRTKELEEAIALSRLQNESLKKALEDLISREVLPVRLPEKGLEGGLYSELLREMDELVRESGLVLVKIDPQPQEMMPPCVVYPFSVEVRGTFSGMLNFFNQLERSLLLVPASWSVEVSGKDDEELKGTFKVKANLWSGQKLVLKEDWRKVQLTQMPKEARNPFSRTSKAPPVTREPLDPMVLSGTISIGGRMKAIIDGKAYGLGDLVRGKRIISITESEVLLEGHSRPLRIERPLKRVEERRPKTGGETK